MKEFFRKQLVTLKRKPQRITMVLLVLCCVVYTFSLTEHSNTVIYTSVSTDASRFVPLFLFCTTLLSILAIFTYAGAYPRGKRNLFMVILVYVLLVLQLGMDAGYVIIVNQRIASYLASGTKHMPDYIDASLIRIYIHAAIIVLALLAQIFMPVYHKALKKIDTSTDNE